MSHIAVDQPVFHLRRGRTKHPMLHLFRLVMRHRRAVRARRRLLRQLLDHARDARALADIGVVPPPQSVLERWPGLLAHLNR